MDAEIILSIPSAAVFCLRDSSREELATGDLTILRATIDRNCQLFMTVGYLFLVLQLIPPC